MKRINETVCGLACPLMQGLLARVNTRRAAYTLLCVGAFWLAGVPAARAQDADETVPPDKTAWGLVCLVLVTTWVLMVSLRAPQKLSGRTRPRLHRSPRRRFRRRA